MIRLIGDPETATAKIRSACARCALAAKLNMNISAETAEPIPRLAAAP